MAAANSRGSACSDQIIGADGKGARSIGMLSVNATPIGMLEYIVKGTAR